MRVARLFLVFSFYLLLCLTAEGQQTLTFVVGDCKFDMVRVQGGSYYMGCEAINVNRGKYDEFPLHAVRVDDYYLGRYEVTQRLWTTVMGYNPSNFRGDELPVEQVNYFEVKEFIRRLDSLTGYRFRLPTEAEWEYAARGGRKSGGHTFAGNEDATKVGWGQANSGDSTHAVGRLTPNELGLYDMTGNVWEWCNDWYRDLEYAWHVGKALGVPRHIKTTGALEVWLMSTGKLHHHRGSNDIIRLLRETEFEEETDNPHGPETGEFRLGRGGSWADAVKDLRIAYRNMWVPERKLSVLGFRLALSIDKKDKSKTNANNWMPNQYTIDSIVDNKIYTSPTTQRASRMVQGALVGMFSVGPEKQVRFSAGNLQYNSVAGLWRFADQQYSIIGVDNIHNDKQYGGWVDLFAWGTSGYREKYPYYFSSNSTYYGNGADNNIDGTNYDWGVYNRISNGGNKPGMWRTLSMSEWDYLLTKRHDALLLHTTGQVEGVQGMVLLPDDWLQRGFDTLRYNTNYIFTPAQWLVMERAGAVFLPAAGICHYSNYTPSLPYTDNPIKNNVQIEGFNVDDGSQIPMVHQSVRSESLRNDLITDTEKRKNNPPTAAEEELNIKTDYAPAIEGNEQIGYYWTTIHNNNVSAMGMCFAIDRSVSIMPFERMLRCSVRLVQDVEN